MEVSALDVRAALMDSDYSEEDKITALIGLIECIDEGHPFPQLVTDALISVNLF